MFDRFWPVPVSVPTGDPSVLMLSVGDRIHVTINRSESAHWIEVPAPRLDVALSTGDRGRDSQASANDRLRAHL